MSKKIVIFGAGGFGREVANMITNINLVKPTYNLLGFVVEKKYFKENIEINDLPILGDEDWLLEHSDVYCVCAIADVKSRSRIQKELQGKGIKFETIVSLGAYVAPYTSIGAGCVFYPGVLVAPNVTIGDGVLLNSYVTIGHDAVIEEYASVMPGTGISGKCYIGKQALIGGHAFINPNKKIGECAVVAAGSIVFSNVKAGTTVIGNPAHRMKEIE